MNESGSIIKMYTYDAFGVEQNKASSDMNPFRYCGEYYDKETDNIYLRARYYDSSTGRFISEDPIKDGLNWYSYCNGNPVMFSDPSGLAPGDIIESSLEGLSEQNISNINSAVDAAKAGYITKEASARNILLNGGKIEKFNRYSVVEESDTITIKAYVLLDTNYTDGTKNPPKYSVEEYENAIIRGIEDEWSGTYKGKNIKVELEKCSKDFADALPIITRIFTEGGPYYSYYYEELYMYIRTGHGEYTLDKLKMIAAHEFAHAAFRLRDLYKDSRYKHVKSIMNKALLTGRTELDYEMMAASSLLKDTSIYDSRGFDDIIAPYIS
ncbi:MAG: RHS repeat-associated core domain-containing protein [bacterium]|nr:RHS repeat-associated core domain-containing protein [bacterium]